jgi:alpha-beta hydrolase superfamily lysophospholipase
MEDGMDPVFDHAALAHIDLAGLPGRTFITVRDRTPIAARVYGAPSDLVVVAIHGSSAEGTYLHALAQSLVETAETWVVDLRGHGASGGRRGDVDYIGQLEDDLDDVLAAIHALRAHAKIVLLGHSSGGGLVVRWAGRTRRPHVDGFALLAPFLGATAPTTRPSSGGWAIVDVPKTIELATKAAAGDPSGQDAVTVRFQKPESVRTGREVLAYTFRMMVSFAPHEDLQADLRGVDAPLLLVAGADDEAFYADRYEAVVPGSVHILPGAHHLDVVVDPRAHEEIRGWLGLIFRARQALTAA